MVAGYGIAVPVGPIAILVIDTALRGGFRPGSMAAAGAASADFIYAGLAAVAGEVIAAALAPLMLALRIASAVVLLTIGGYGLRRARVVKNREDGEPAQIRGGIRTYAQFLGLTLLNPLTVTYFGALILGGRVETLGTTPGRVLFVIGAWLASLSWQVFLATVGALARRRLSPRFQVLTSVAGNVIVIALGLRVLAEVVG
jgi:threonine/homoserine/homoserine lactone efflux protein